MNPIAYMCIIELISGILAAPYILWRHRPGIFEGFITLKSA